MFHLAVCKCSQRTAEEEALLGSYCQKCWNVLHLVKKCNRCTVPIETTRLYVTTEKIVLCRNCFQKGGW